MGAIQSAWSASTDFDSALSVEPIPSSETLPDTYPDTWVFAHDMNFGSMVDGKILIIDVAADTRNFKGMFGAGMAGMFQTTRASSELYSAQTILSRRTYGDRTDVVIIFDKSTLLPIDEILLPPVRLQMVTQPNAFQLIDNAKMGLIMNFTPAASVTAVNLSERTVLQEIPLPGCNFIYPTGKRGFSSLCADGAMISFALGEDGSVQSSKRIEPFIDIDADPLFAKSIVLNDITYFLSYQGRIQPIDMTGSEPVILDDWRFVPENLHEADWLPSGWQVLGASSNELFVLMAPGGEEGSHKSGGSEIWVLDMEGKKLARRIELPNGGLSFVVTQSDPAYLAVVNANMEMDVFDAASGDHRRTLHLGMAATPFVLYAN